MRVDDEIELRLPDRYQLPALYDLANANREKLAQHMFWIQRCRSYAQMVEMMIEARQDYAAHRAVTAHIFYRGDVAGWVRLHSIDSTHQSGEIGYWIGARFYHKGIVTRSVSALLDYAFTRIQLNRIVIQCAADNPRSCAVAERLGFVHEGVQAQQIVMPDGMRDVHVYRMLAQDWQATRYRPYFAHRVDVHLELRLFALRHAQPLFALVDANRAHLREWLNWVDGNTQVEDSRQFIRDSLDHFAEESGMHMGIWYEDELVGAISYNDLNFRHRKAEIGYWLAADQQGRGIITRSARALLRYAFEVLGFERLTILCAAGNDRSCAVAQRLGFAHEGVLRDHGWLYDRYVDMHVYALLAEDWTP